MKRLDTLITTLKPKLVWTVLGILRLDSLSGTFSLFFLHIFKNGTTTKAIFFVFTQWINTLHFTLCMVISVSRPLIWAIKQNYLMILNFSRGKGAPLRKLCREINLLLFGFLPLLLYGLKFLKVFGWWSYSHIFVGKCISQSRKKFLTIFGIR